MASNGRADPMDDDDTQHNASPNQADNPSAHSRDPTPQEELDRDINNLSIEDSPAGPVVRISDNEVGIIPDSQPITDGNICPVNTLTKELQFSTSNLTKSTSDSCISTLNSITYNSISKRFSRQPTLECPLPTDVQQHSPHSPTENNNTDTPFSSATELVTDKTKGAISKRTSNQTNSGPKTSDNRDGCRPITQFLRPITNSGSNSRNPPNICSWAEDYKKKKTVPHYPLPADLDILPQRPCRKRIRHNTSDESQTQSNTTTPSSLVTNEERSENDLPDRGNTIDTNMSTVDYINSRDNSKSNPVSNSDKPTADGHNQSDTNHTSTNTGRNSKTVSFTLQKDTSDAYLPIPAEGLPFFRRARGCFSAEARAHSRADHIDRLCDNGKPAKWAYGMGPMPPYIEAVAKDLIGIKRRHALELSRAIARSLRDSALASRRQGTLNLDTVQTIYANDEAGFERATSKMTTLVSRDNGQEVEKLSRREEIISRSPTTDEDITNHLSNHRVAARSYAGVVANDPPQINNQEQNNRAPNNNGPGRRNRRSRSRSRGRNNRNSSRERSRNRNASRSPLRDQENQGGNRRNNTNGRVAQPSRRPSNNANRRNNNQQRNRYRERPGASEFMEQMFEFFQKRN